MHHWSLPCRETRTDNTCTARSIISLIIGSASFSSPPYHQTAWMPRYTVLTIIKLLSATPTVLLCFAVRVHFYLFHCVMLSISQDDNGVQYLRWIPGKSFWSSFVRFTHCWPSDEYIAFVSPNLGRMFRRYILTNATLGHTLVMHTSLVPESWIFQSTRYSP